MKNINSYRKFERNDKQIREDGEYVLYWMQINRRFQYNYALELAVAYANKLDKPLLIYEGLNIDYPWASDRIHSFMMEGMKENLDFARSHSLNFHSYIEKEKNAGRGLLYKLAENACVVISDEYPVFIIRDHNQKVADKLEIPYITVDSNGIIPLGITDKDPYSAYLFRKVMQKHFVEAFTQPPQKDPLGKLVNKDRIELSEDFLNKYPQADDALSGIPDTIHSLDIDHSVKPVPDMTGTRQSALGKLGHFIAHSLFQYDDQRNHPDANKASGLSHGCILVRSANMKL